MQLLFYLVYYHSTCFIDAKQAKEVHLYQNTKRKLYKTTAAIWYNKTSPHTQ